MNYLKFTLLLLFLIPSIVIAHGTKKAYFDLHKKGSEYFLAVTVEEDDFRVVSGKAKASIPELKKLVGRFLVQHFKVEQNETYFNLIQKSVEHKNRHFTILYRLLEFKPKGDIKFSSDYLNKTFPKHKNILRIHLEGYKKDYILSPEKTSVELKF